MPSSFEKIKQRVNARNSFGEVNTVYMSPNKETVKDFNHFDKLNPYSQN